MALPGVRQDRKASLWSTVVSILSKKATHPARAANPGGQTLRMGHGATPTMHIGPTANIYTLLAKAKSWAPFSTFSHAECSWLAACVTEDVMSWSTFAVVLMSHRMQNSKRPFELSWLREVPMELVRELSKTPSSAATLAISATRAAAL